MPVQPLPERPAPGFDLAPAFAAVWRRRARILAVSAAAALLTLGIAFLLPKWYRATAVTLPPEEADLMSNMSLAARALSKFPSFGILPDYFTPADIYKAILGSRTVQEDVIREHRLQEIYGLKSMEKTLKTLKGHTRVRLNPDGTIAVSVEDRDPKRAAAMANSYLRALDSYNVEKRNTQAHRARVFLQNRLAETDSLLRASEMRLRRYGEAHHTVAPTSVSSGDIQAAADLMARKMSLEVRLGVLRNYLREENDQVVQTRLELDQLNRRISMLPGLQSALATLIRDVKVQEQLYLLLTAEFEQARIRESMDTPIVQVLDPAVPPERHSKPRRFVLAVAAGLLAAGGAIAWAVMSDLRSPRPEP